MNVAVLTSAEGAEMSPSSSDSVDAVVLCGWCLPQRLLMVLEGGFVKYALGMEGSGGQVSWALPGLERGVWRPLWGRVPIDSLEIVQVR